MMSLLPEVACLTSVPNERLVGQSEATFQESAVADSPVPEP